MNKQQLIERLGLEPHAEGGYYRRTFQADYRDRIPTPAGKRLTLTSIYYLLTEDSPVGHWHLNASDIMHFFQAGQSLEYFMILPDGQLQRAVLGPDLVAGQQLQLAVKGGVWKASRLTGGEYGLVGEAVSPGFDTEDMQLGQRQLLLDQFPQHRELIETLSAP